MTTFPGSAPLPTPTKAARLFDGPRIYSLAHMRTAYNMIEAAEAGFDGAGATIGVISRRRHPYLTGGLAKVCAEIGKTMPQVDVAAVRAQEGATTGSPPERDAPPPPTATTPETKYS